MTITPQEIEEVTTLKVACMGDLENRSEGHPKVWLRISPAVGAVTCPYCDKNFVLKKN
jgi:uncharacterized Zn-finger protein